MYLNVVVLGGNLTRDIELRYTQTGTAVASFGLAVNKKYTSNGENREDVSFFDIDVWGKTAEVCNSYLKKGSGVVVQGELKQESWQQQDGQKRYKVKVVANSVQFLPRSDGGSGNSNSGQQRSNQGYSNSGNKRNDPPF